MDGCPFGPYHVPITSFNLVSLSIINELTSLKNSDAFIPSTLPMSRRKPLVVDSDDEFGAIDDADFLTAESTAQASRNTLKRKSTSTVKSNPQGKKVKSEAACIPLAQEILQQTWGFSSFRLKQEAVIARLISGHSAVVIFPTGGGKSLVYQIPALAFDEYDKFCNIKPGGGVTLVVSPLIALMKVGFL